MKFIDLLKEPTDDKLLKKAKTIFSVLRKGKITRSDGVSFSYELGGRTHARVYEGEIELIGSVISIKENTYCPLSQRYMTELIENKFKMFGINVELRPPNEDQIEKYQGKKPWEKDELNEDRDIDKEKKRVKTIHKAIRKGVVTVDGNRFKYELPEEYLFYRVHDELVLTSIQFTFHNNDLGDNFGGLALPLRVWRIEEGKDVFLNGVLTKEDVSDIVYGDEYLINTKSGVDYVNVKSKVRNKYRDFDINIITTTPSNKTIMTIYEGEEDRLIKKGKTVFKALKKGTIGSKDDSNEPHFKYELSDNINIDRNNVGIILTTDRIKIKELNRACRHNDPDYMSSLIRKRFSHFGILLTSPYGDRYFNYDVEPWKSSMNEHAEVLNPESLTNKEIKKVKLIYKSFKEMIFKFDDQKSNYGIVLPENYYIYKDELGDVCIKLEKEDSEKLYVFSRVKFMSGDHLDREIESNYDGLHRWVRERVINKFDGFNIKFIF